MILLNRSPPLRDGWLPSCGPRQTTGRPGISPWTLEAVMKILIRTLGPSVVLAGLLAGCGHESTTSPLLLNPYSISGKVSDFSGNGLPGVSVGFSHRITVTGTDGTYTLADLTSGTYTLVASKSGVSFSPSDIVVTVDGASVTGKDFAVGSAELYREDFGRPAGWVTNNSGKFFQQSMTHTYHYALTDGASEHAYKSVPAIATVLRSVPIRLEFDVLPDTTETAGNFLMGLSGSSMDAYGGSNVLAAAFDFEGANRVLVLKSLDGDGVVKSACSSSAGTPVGASFADGVWYRVVVQYDAVENTATMRVSNKNTQDEVWRATLSGLGKVASLDRVFTSSIGDIATGATARGRVDRVIVQAGPRTPTP